MKLRNAVIIPVHNALPYLERTLNALGDPSITSMDVRAPIILVNDASDVETSEYMVKYARQTGCTVLHNTTQQLFTRTVNRGLRKAREWYNPHVYTVINSDCDLKPGWLEAMLQIMINESDMGFVGYRDSPPDPPSAYAFDVVDSPGYVTGHLMMLRAAALEKVGVFCETDVSGIHYPEFAPYKGLAHIGSDRHMSNKLQAAGYRVAYCNYPGVEHEAGKSWNHNLGWLAAFNLQPMWEANDFF